MLTDFLEARNAQVWLRGLILWQAAALTQPSFPAVQFRGWPGDSQASQAFLAMCTALHLHMAFDVPKNTLERPLWWLLGLDDVTAHDGQVVGFQDIPRDKKTKQDR